MRRISLAGLSVTLLWLATMHAAAQDEDPRAVVTRAQAEYEAGRPAAAGPLFERAFELTAHPSMLYNAYVAYRDALQPRDALRALDGWLGVALANDPDRPSLESRRAALAARVAELDGEPAEPDATSTVETTPAETAPLEPTTPRGAANEPELLAPAILLGVGGASLLAAAVVGGVAIGDHDAFVRDCAASCPELSDRAEAGRSLAIATDVLWASGAAIATAGLIWLVVALTTHSTDVASVHPEARF